MPIDAHEFVSGPRMILSKDANADKSATSPKTDPMIIVLPPRLRDMFGDFLNVMKCFVSRKGVPPEERAGGTFRPL